MNIYKCDEKLYPHLETYIDAEKIGASRIISAGDIHGDLDLAISFLTIPSLIKRVEKEEKDENCVEINYKDIEKRYYKWIGKDTIFIQVGDQVDRCRPTSKACIDIIDKNDENSDINILFMYYELNLIALKHNCMVISLLGNHEIMNILGDLRYVSRRGILDDVIKDKNIDYRNENAKDYKKEGIELRENKFKIGSSFKIFKNKNSMTEFLACSRLATVVVSDYMFVHAGVLEDLLKHTQSFKKIKNNDKREVLSVINEYIKQWLLNYAHNKEEKKFINELLLNTNRKRVGYSPFWPRMLGKLKEGLNFEDERCKNHIKPIIDFLNIKAVIVGHTPQNYREINGTCDNTIWRVDVAASKAFGVFNFLNFFGKKNHREPQVLQILLKPGKNQNKFSVLK